MYFSQKSYPLEHLGLQESDLSSFYRIGAEKNLFLTISSEKRIQNLWPLIHMCSNQNPNKHALFAKHIICGGFLIKTVRNHIPNSLAVFMSILHPTQAVSHEVSDKS